ncbi:unnamed protein product [Heligmosomoides polygyrus]|uniref:Transmembrane protein n=1 Tax=Heligmosomoides polygyrus TaxID=6339 RepID=A0A183GN72_HELPZ|nr:unnamed protein product [Heligmosomoides polygyrus]
MLVVRPRAFTALVVCAFLAAVATVLLVTRPTSSASLSAHSLPTDDLLVADDVLQPFARAKYSEHDLFSLTKIDSHVSTSAIAFPTVLSFVLSDDQRRIVAHSLLQSPFLHRMLLAEVSCERGDLWPADGRNVSGALRGLPPETSSNWLSISCNSLQLVFLVDCKATQTTMSYGTSNHERKSVSVPRSGQ